MSIELILALASALLSAVNVLVGLRFYLLFGRKWASIGWLILLLATILIAFSEWTNVVLAVNKTRILVPSIFSLLAEITLLIAFLRMYYIEFANLSNQLDGTKKLVQAFEHLATSLDRDNLQIKILNQALILINADMGAIYPLDGAEDKTSEHVIFVRRTSDKVGETFHPAGNLTRQILSSCQPQFIEDLNTYSTITPLNIKSTKLVSLAGLPLRHEGKINGVLFIGFDQRHIFPFYERQLLILFASQAALSIYNAELHHQVEQLSITDPLTGLANRRQFDRNLEQELARAHRYGKPLSLLILDLDHFKQINDTWGHPAGDAVLMAVAKVLRESARNADLPARVGGEEIALLMPETGMDGAAIIAERLCLAISEISVNWQEHVIHTTCSIGVAGGNSDELPLELSVLYEQADLALYQAKATGRNQVITFGKVYN